MLSTILKKNSSSPGSPLNHIALCLGGHIKVRVPGATIARKNTCVIITPQYYAPSELS